MPVYILSDLVDIRNEKENNPQQSEYERFVGLEHYTPGAVTIKNYGNTDLLTSGMKIFHAGDILIARRNVYLRRASIVLFDGITSGDSIVLIPKDDHFKQLLPFILNSDDFWNYATQNADGSMSKRLSPKDLLNYEFVLPPFEEQIHFIDLLWAINDTLESYKDLLVKTDEMVKSRFIEMFGDPVTNPMGWEVLPLQKIVTEDCTITYGIVQTGDPQKEGIPVFRPVDIVNHYPQIDELKKTTKDISDRYKRTLLHGDELLITVRANIADTCIIGNEFAGCNVGSFL